MFDLSRRVFLQIAGLAGASAAAPAFSLFSTAPTLGAGGDFVFERGVKPLIALDSRAYHLFRHGGGSASYMVTRGSRNWRQTESWTPQGKPIEYRVDLPEASKEGSDPLVEFFLAAENLRDQIRSDSEGIARDISSLSGGSIATVTRVYTPIITFPHPDKGMYLGCSVERFFVDRGSVLNSSDAVSTRGEVPMHVPGDVELKYLLLTQEELLLRGMLKPDRHGLNALLRTIRAKNA